MCLRRVILCVFLACIAALGQTAQKGVEAADIDRKADPCNDFFQYANGAWRAANPIPASMQRWSRRWASGELAKDQLKEILDDASKKTDWPKGSIEQQIGDYYGACMSGRFGLADALISPCTLPMARQTRCCKGISSLVWNRFSTVSSA